MVVELGSKWLKLLNTEIIRLHPLQFANCERLKKHKAIYLFDEVGSGKTISSGIMALEYLEHNPNQNVLVITTNALTQKTSILPNGQFLEDWIKLLPFEELGYESKITVLNNHYSKFKNKKEYGLVIIDEAHLFLNEETLRYQYLIQNIKADKVVFLTATPIKDNTSDLNKYINIAEKLIRETLDHSWINKLTTYGKNPEDLICSQFSLDLPVTRYFKDTIKSLGHNSFNKTKAKRHEILTWEYSSKVNKNTVLANKISDLYKDSTKNKFVIFTRYVEKEAQLIGEVFEELGFSKFEKKISDNPTYKIVTGENRQDLADFSSNEEDNLPTVLILTYQISEQGINLPGFNHIVNYHISSFPSALEQRFGRIDRLNNNYEKIYNCFLIQSDYFDTNTFNFYSAINTSVYTLLTAIPSRNTLLSKKTLKHYVSKIDLVEKYVERIRSLLTEENIKNLYDYLCAWDEQISLANSIKEDLQELVELVQESQIDIDASLNRFESLKQLEKEMKDTLIDIKRHFNETKTEKEIINKLLQNDDSIWDQVFYSKDRRMDGLNYVKIDLNTADAINDCAEAIKEDPFYKCYLKSFNQSIKIPLEFKVYKSDLNSIFEKAFRANEFEKIFPQIQNKNYIDIIPMEGISHLVQENINVLIHSLPFFKMVNLFKKELIYSNYTEQGYLREKFSRYHHPFATAMGRLTTKKIDISKEFYDFYFADYKEFSYTNHFKQFFFSKEDTCEKDGQKQISVVASPWLKLTYHLTREQSLMCSLKYDLYGNNYYLEKIYDPHEDPQREYPFTKSLFEYMIFTNNNKFRSWSSSLLLPNLKYKQGTNQNDYWTKSLMNSIYDARHDT